jgi:glutamate dehydrogenase
LSSTGTRPATSTDDGLAAAVAAANATAPELAALIALYFEHTPPEYLTEEPPGQLLDAVRSHRELAARRRPGEALIRVLDGPRPRTDVVEIVTDDMPFLVESVAAAATRVAGSVRRLIHPIVPVRRAPDGALQELLCDADPATPPPGAIAESWMRLVLAWPPERSPGEAAADRAELERELRDVLAEVRMVVEDTPAMLDRARSVADALIDVPPPLAPTTVQDSARLLSWLADGHFTFLGARRFGGAEARPLGVLRDEEVCRRLSPRRTGPDGSREKSAHLPPGEVLVVSQASEPSRVFRPVHPFYVVVGDFDVDGNLTGENHFVGMLTVSALYENVLDIPMIARRVRKAIQRAGFPLQSYSGQRMLEVITTYPREELFSLGEQELHDIALAVLTLEPRRVRLFLRQDPYRRYFSCVVYLPRDRYTTRSRLAMQQVLVRELHGTSISYSARISNSVFAQVRFTVHTARDVPAPPPTRLLQDQLSDAILTWDDRVLEVAGVDEPEASELQRQLAGVPEAYKEDVDPAQAPSDLRRIARLGEAPDMYLHVPPDAAPDRPRFKLFLAGEGITLTDALPVLQHMGVDVLDERPYEIHRPDGRRCWIYDFGLRLDAATMRAVSEREPAAVERGFAEAFAAALRGDAEVDRFNSLVLRAGLTWRQVALLRGYARYQRQIGSRFGQDYIAEILLAHTEIAVALVRLFTARFDPDLPEPDRPAALDEALRAATTLIDAITALDADRILRGFLSLIMATMRTNYYRDERHIAVKLDPGRVPDAPLPRPRFEIFVCSPLLEGVHLRFGPVARGGLRHSDRPEDYRTEILGLVKAQEVKNAVIVPVGAKGGFVIAHPESGPSEVLSGYRTFVGALLELTDNLVDGKTIPPPRVVRYDPDDSYLVVAADKGTARFSDVANEIAAERGFWLGDAFASGGSIGYDHKAMGITARGAWCSVQRHFRELGIDVQREPFTVIGIGDMSGDVFGNGMLASDQIRLVAAFDHRHVFVDPNPDPAVGFVERKRLFALPQSSWDDYDRGLISAGGGVWPRTVKGIPVSEQMRSALGLPDGVESLTPPEAIRAILAAPAQLLWNGGIGTYVKATDETNAEVGDKANDLLRVDADRLRVRVVGEGGNLGLTQRARIEFARAGGKVNTDALDNSAGVDCSDHEVNIKILLDRLVRDAVLTRAERDELLLAMTDEVAGLVLRDNVSQNAALGAARAHASDMVTVHRRMVSDLAARRGLDRELEVLPDDGGFVALEQQGAGLVSPELATLLAHAKLDLKGAVLSSELPNLPAFEPWLDRYFPAVLRQRYAAAIEQHPLRREITTTALVNEVVDRAGISYVFRLGEELSAAPTDGVLAYTVTVGVFGLHDLWAAIDAAGSATSTDVVDELVLESRRLLDRGSRWFLVSRPQPLDVAAEVARFGARVAELSPRVPGMLRGREAAGVVAHAERLRGRGVPPALAEQVACALHTFALLDVIEIAEQASAESGGRIGYEPAEVARLYFALSEHLAVDLALASVTALERPNRWHLLARLGLRDDFYGALRAITLDALRGSEPGQDIEEIIERWERANASRLRRARAALLEVTEAGRLDLATLSVVSRLLRGLAR